MEKFQELREKALKSVKAADHMLGVSYPLLNDPKILVSVANNLLLAVDSALESVLEHEKLFKRINTIPQSTDAKYALLKQRSPVGFEDLHFEIISDLSEISGKHKSSAVEFPRDGKFVIATDTYELRTLSVKELKDYLSKTKQIVEKLYEMTRKNDGIFR
jgi:hypothetical protein